MKLKNKYCSKTAQERLFQLDIPIVGLTGGIASGKSTVSNRLKSLGFFVIDADQLIKSIYKKKESIQFVSKNFPSAFISGAINFPELRKIIFAKEENLKTIEQFLYPQLPSAFRYALEQSPQRPECVIYDIPLLFERGFDEKFDHIVCVYTPEKIQRARVSNRDGSSDQVITNILKKQINIEEKKKRSSSVIENIGTLNELDKNVDHWVESFFTKGSL